MWSFLGFLLFAVLAIFLVGVVVILFLLKKGVDLVRRIFGLPPRDPFSQNTRSASGNASHRTTRTREGVTIIDHRSEEQANKKIFAPDEGEYVDFKEE